MQPWVFVQSIPVVEMLPHLERVSRAHGPRREWHRACQAARRVWSFSRALTYKGITEVKPVISECLLRNF